MEHFAEQKYLQPGQKLKLYVDVTKVSVWTRQVNPTVMLLDIEHQQLVSSALSAALGDGSPTSY